MIFYYHTPACYKCFLEYTVLVNENDNAYKYIYVVSNKLLSTLQYYFFVAYLISNVGGSTLLYNSHTCIYYKLPFSPVCKN